ncbi:MAG: hypothetical protein PHR16_17845 [Methylovulum sp.]|nr:hypothetical protein [Methylovulum sp.]
MTSELVIGLIQQGSQLISEMIRNEVRKPHARYTQVTETVVSQPVETKIKVKLEPETKTEVKLEPVTMFHPETTSDEDYRWECCTKHLGAAAVLLREAHERAVTNKTVDDSVAEKVMAALNEHAGMDDDVKVMLSNPNARDAAQRLMDGCRQLRRAAWDCKITIGGGTVDDVADARLWNDMLYQQAYSEAKKHSGQECIRTGM